MTELERKIKYHSQSWTKARRLLRRFFRGDRPPEDANASELRFWNLLADLHGVARERANQHAVERTHLKTWKRNKKLGRVPGELSVRINGRKYVSTSVRKARQAKKARS